MISQEKYESVMSNLQSALQEEQDRHPDKRLTFTAQGVLHLFRIVLTEMIGVEDDKE